jgi:hypothetical protein
VPELLRGAAFAALFSSFTRSAQRLETRDRYAGDQVLFEQWLRGQLDEPELADKVAAWLGSVRATTAAGGRFERVRVVSEPPTDYQRFALATCRASTAAGEDIRYLDRALAVAHDLPAHDFWLFDGVRLALLYFTADDRMLGAQVIAEPAVVAQHQRWFDAAAALATTYADYLASEPGRAHRRE